MVDADTLSRHSGTARKRRLRNPARNRNPDARKKPVSGFQVRSLALAARNDGNVVSSADSFVPE
jgi:hypothetical protein